ncbi:MAG: putative DCC family thiol-disulfide oxidoreductase YuxK [Saprospiraceae bacterium]|jgi:predicted DCC family thiol-disulfide oxidoreductase YuxK
MIIPTDKPLLFFDGVCNLCSGFVQFVIERDPTGKFRFASLQSEAGRQVLQDIDMSETELSTVVLLKDGKTYTHSDVALEMSLEIGGLWTLFYVFKIIPKVLRDKIYDWVAVNRYKWFGEKESCWLPTPELQARFLN